MNGSSEESNEDNKKKIQEPEKQGAASGITLSDVGMQPRDCL